MSEMLPLLGQRRFVESYKIEYRGYHPRFEASPPGWLDVPLGTMPSTRLRIIGEARETFRLYLERTKARIQTTRRNEPSILEVRLVGPSGQVVDAHKILVEPLS